MSEDRRHLPAVYVTLFLMTEQRAGGRRRRVDQAGWKE